MADARFRNHTSVPQTYYLRNGASVGPVNPGKTVVLDEEFGRSHRRTLERVEEPADEPQDDGSDESTSDEGSDEVSDDGSGGEQAEE